jgi:hypothetical protein
MFDDVVEYPTSMSSAWDVIRKRPRAIPARLVAFGLALASLLCAVGRPPRAGGLPHPVPVLIIGGSAAAGWVDLTGPGYVARGVLGFGDGHGLDFRVTNHAIPGAPVVDGTVRRQLRAWVSRLGSGGIVVLAWGLLNDLRLHVAPSRIKRALERQIRIALGASDVVLLVTPPATRPSYVQDRYSEPRLVDLEIRVARSFHSRAVYVANVFSTEKRFLRTRGESYTPLMHGLWDPNTRGQKLAGRLLMRVLTRVVASQALSVLLERLQARTDGLYGAAG